MKKVILFVVGLILLSIITNANGDQGLQKSLKAESGEKCFGEGTKILNFGIGLGGSYYRGYSGNGYSYKSIPYMNVSYEQAYPKKLGPGYLGIGAYFGYSSATARYDGLVLDWNGPKYYYEHKWRNIVAAARGVYHWDVLNAKNAEVYGGLLLGLRFQTYSFNSDMPEASKNYYKYSGSSIWPTFSLFAGARWYFVENVAVYGELGYGISYLNAGISLKF
jgi:hypothetical protein